MEQLASEVGTDATVVRFSPTPDCAREMAALRVGDAKMLRRRVHVRESVTEVEGQLEWSSPRSYEQRMVPFPAFLADELGASMIGKRPDDLIFAAPEAGVLRVSNWRRRVFNKALKRLVATDATFPVVTPHDLRHTAASLAISAAPTSRRCSPCWGRPRRS